MAALASGWFVDMLPPFGNSNSSAEVERCPVLAKADGLAVKRRTWCDACRIRPSNRTPAWQSRLWRKLRSFTKSRYCSRTRSSPYKAGILSATSGGKAPVAYSAVVLRRETAGRGGRRPARIRGSRSGDCIRRVRRDKNARFSFQERHQLRSQERAISSWSMCAATRNSSNSRACCTASRGQYISHMKLHHFAEGVPQVAARIRVVTDECDALSGEM